MLNIDAIIASFFAKGDSSVSQNERKWLYLHMYLLYWTSKCKSVRIKGMQCKSQTRL